MDQPPLIHPALARELEHLRDHDGREYRAVAHAIRVLWTTGAQLGFPYTSAIRTSGNITLRELRPRRGRSRYRVLYAPRHPAPILLALAPEASHNPRGFQRSVGEAIDRLAEYDQEHDNDICN